MTVRLVVLLAAFGTAAVAQTVHTSDGRRISGRLLALDAAGAVVQTQAGDQRIPIGDLAGIALVETAAEALLARKGRHIVWTHDDTCLAVRDVTIRDSRLRAVAAGAGTVDIPLERVARLLRPAANQTPDELDRQVRDLGAAAGKEDTLVVRSSTAAPVAMNGIVSSLDRGRIAFTYDGAETSMPDDSVAAVLFAAPTPAATQPAHMGRLTTTDGSRIVFQALRLERETFVTETAALGPVRLPAQAVAHVQFDRAGAVWLSDLPPADARHAPFFDDPFPWQKDRSVSGHPLAAGGARYERGLGLHAQTHLTFDLQGRYRRLSAIAGIDDEVRAGRAILSLAGDGKPLGEPLTLDRSKPPQRINLELRGVRRLTLIVDFASGDFGSGARVNLCDPALIP